MRRSFVCAISAAAILSLASTARAATITELQVAGSTGGCLGTTATCIVFSSPISTAAGGSTIGFTGASFDEMTDAAGTATVALGTFTRTPNVNFTSAFSLDFTLRVTFDIPANITGGQSVLLEADLIGTISGANSHLNVDFANNGWTTFLFANALGEGSFEFALSDPASMPRTQSSRTLTGSIRNATFTEFEPAATVPEPASLLLFGAGLAGLAADRRRRARRA